MQNEITKLISENNVYKKKYPDNCVPKNISLIIKNNNYKIKHLQEKRDNLYCDTKEQLKNNILKNNSPTSDNKLTEPEVEQSEPEVEQSEPELVDIEYEDDIPIDLENLKKNLTDSKFIVKKDFFIKHLQGKIYKLNDSNRYLDHKI